MELSDWTLSQESPTPRAIILTDASQWYDWFSIVETNAKVAKIWDLIDPSLEQEPPHTEPPLPKMADIRADNETTRSLIYAEQMAQFHDANEKYQRQQTALTRALPAIQKSVSEDYLWYILHKSSPWQALRALQERIEPDYRMFVALQQHRSNGQNSRPRAVAKTRGAQKRRRRC